MRVNSYPIVMVPINELTGVHNPVQPGNRVKTDADLVALQKAIKKTRYISPCLIARAPKDFPDKYIPLDGHRRIRAALVIGVTQIPCCILPLTELKPVDWFTWLNLGVKKISGPDWFWIWSMGEGAESYLERMPSVTRASIKYAIQFVGMKDAVRYGRNRLFAPSSFKRIGAFVLMLHPFDYPQSIDGRRCLVEWTVKHNQQGELRRILNLRSRPRTEAQVQTQLQKLLECIEADCPMWNVEKNTYTRPGARKKRVR